MQISGSNIKKFLIFSQKKAFLTIWEMELFYILGNDNPQKIPYIYGNITFFIFRKTEAPQNPYILGNGNLKKLLIFQERTSEL